MADFNPSLMNGNLAQIIQNQQQQAIQNNQQTWAGLGSLAEDLRTDYDKQLINQSIQKNYDPATGQVNQQGLLSDLFTADPQKAMLLQQQMEKQQLAQLKGQGDYTKDIAQANLYKAQTQDKDAEKQVKQYDQLNRLISNSNNQEDMDRAIAFAKKSGFAGVDLFEGKTFSPELKAQALSASIDGKTQAQLAMQERKTALSEQRLDKQGQMTEYQKAQLALKQQQQKDGGITPYQQAQLDIRMKNANKENTQVIDTASGLKIVNKDTGAARDVNGVVSKEQNKQNTETQAKLIAGESTLASVDRSISYLDRLINNPGLDYIVGPRAQYIPDALMGDKHIEAKADLESVKSKIVLNVMQELKQASATGATGFGALSEKELKILQDSLGSLSRAQTPDQLRENLNNIRSEMARIKENANKIINQEKNKIKKPSDSVNQLQNAQGLPVALPNNYAPAPREVTDAELASKNLSREKYNAIMAMRARQGL